MKRKFLEDLGLTKEQVDSIMNENGKDINEAKGELETFKTELKSAKDTIQERDTQLEELKKSAGDNEDLKKQIETLQTENKTTKEKYETELKDLQISNAIKLAIADKAQDAELLSGLFDKSKLILGEDGKVTGLDEQLKVLQEGKPFLFKEEKPDTTNKPEPGFKVGNPNSNPQPKNETFSMKDAIAAKLQSQQ